MSYDLQFLPRADASLPTFAALQAWAQTRPDWHTHDHAIGYSDRITGLDFSLYRTQRDDDDSLSLSMAGHAAHVAGQELVRQVAALTAAFELLVSDPQMDGMGDGPLDADKLYAGWTFYNGFATKTAHTLLGQPVGPHLPAAQLEQAVAWNRARAESLATGAADDHWFVPEIAYLAAPDGTAQTYVAWVGGKGSLPVVDVLVTPLGLVPWAKFGALLAKGMRTEAPAPHYVLDEQQAALLDGVIGAQQGEPARLDGVTTRQIRTSEVVQPYRGGLLASTDTETLRSSAILAHQTNDRKQAFAVAKRLLEVDPDSYVGAIVAAINGQYLAAYDEALRCLEAALRINASDRTVQIIRCAVMTDLARYDEAIDAADRALVGKPDAMVVNCKAYALAAAGRSDEAAAAYLEALALLDATLVDQPDDGDVISRRAWALLGLDRAKEAADAATQAMPLVSDPFLTLQSLGRARLQQGDVPGAIEALTSAIAAREAAPMASYYLALAFAQSDRRDDARTALAAAAINPHFRALATREALLAPLL